MRDPFCVKYVMSTFIWDDEKWIGKLLTSRMSAELKLGAPVWAT